MLGFVAIDYLSQLEYTISFRETEFESLLRDDFVGFVALSAFRRPLSKRFLLERGPPRAPAKGGERTYKGRAGTAGVS